MQRNRIVSIDIGSHAIKVAVGMKSQEGIEVVGTANVPVQGVVCGVVTDVEKCTQALKKAFVSVKAKETDVFIIGLSNYYVERTKSIQSKYIAEREKIKEDDLDDLYEKAENAYLKEELELLDVCARYYNVDDMHGIQNPVGMQGVKLEATYTIFSCRKTLLANIRECVSKAGGKVDEFIFSPYYSKEILFAEQEQEAGVLVVDLGADVTRASLFVEGALYTSFAVPFGSRSITVDIKNSYPVTAVQAEKLKKQYGCALAELAEENAEVGFKSSDAWGERSLRVSELGGVVQCRLDEIFRGIRYQLREMNLEDDIESIIIIGAGAAQNSLKEYLEKKFCVAVNFGKLKDGAFVNANDLSVLHYANVLGILFFELNEGNYVDYDSSVGFFKKLSGGFSNFFGKKSGGKDTKM